MNSTLDFTRGEPKRLILSFYFPLLVTNTLQQLYSFADTAIVGKGLGDNSLAAVGNMSSLCFLIVGFSMGLSNGFSILIAQNFGKKDLEKLRNTLAHSIELAAVITALLTLFSMIFLRTILNLMQTDPSIMEESLQYGYVLFGGLFATIAYNMCAGILRALGDSRTPLKAIIISSIMNITLNAVFIFICHLGVGGVAVATIISQIFSGMFCFHKLKKTDFLSLSKADFLPDKSMYLVLLKNGVPMAFMNSITAVGCIVVQYFVNGLGVAFTSAYSACSKYLNMFMQPASTAGLAMSSYTSQNYGAKRFDRILTGLKVCTAISAVTYVIFGSIMVFFAETACFTHTERQRTDRPCRTVPTLMRHHDIFSRYTFCYQKRCAGHGFSFYPHALGYCGNAAENRRYNTAYRSYRLFCHRNGRNIRMGRCSYHQYSGIYSGVPS